MSFLNRGLLISTSITILLCGAVMYLCHMRMSRLEEAVSRQNKVIASFLENVQRDVAAGGGSSTGLAAPSASAAAERFIAQSADNVTSSNNVRIVVSEDESEDDDDDDDDSSSEEEDESSASSDTEIETEVDDLPRLTVTEINAAPEIQLTELPPSSGSIKLVHLDGPVPVVSELAAVDITPQESGEDSSSDEDTEDEEEPEPSPEPSPSPSPKDKDSKIKVEDLRKQAIEANLCTKDQAKKLKKAALLALIQTSQGVDGTAASLSITDLEE